LSASSLAAMPISRPQWSESIFRTTSIVNLQWRRQIRSGAGTSPMSGRKADGITWQWCWTCSRAARWAGHFRYGPTLTLLCKHWKWLKSSEGDLRDYFFIRIRVASTPVKNSVSACGAIGYDKVCVAGEIVGITPRWNGCSAASKRNGCRQQVT
jgi:hypothetical protein